MKNNALIMILGKSASGKSTLVEQLCKDLNIKAIPSYTTRQPRYENEQGHTFVTDEEYNQLKNIIAENTFCGNRYCVTQEQIDNTEYSLYVVDCKGVESFKQLYKGNRKVYTVQITCDEKIRVERLKHRYAKISKNELDTLKKVIDRLIADNEEFSDIDRIATYCIDNTFDFEESYRQFKELVMTFINNEEEE